MDRSETRKATLLIMALFVAQPVAIGGWLALIPVVKETLGLTKSELALALIGMPAALIPCFQIAARLVGAWGPRRMLMAFFPLQALAVLLPAFAGGVTGLFFALAVLGAMVAVLEVGINVYAGRLEKRADIMIMNRCHGFWALGLMTGSAIVTVTGGSVSGLIALATVSAVLGVLASRALPRIAEGDRAKIPPRRKPSQLPLVLALVGTMMLFVTMTEGAMADWAAVYLAERLGGDTARAGIAVTIFSGFMAGGRFLGDALKRWMGPVGLARMTILIAIAGLLCLVLPLPLPLLYVGFALVGFGISAAYPLGVSAVAQLDDVYEPANIALVSMVALTGFLVGPPLIGFLADAFTLKVGLGALLPGLILALWLTRWLRPLPPDPKAVRVAAERG